MAGGTADELRHDEDGLARRLMLFNKPHIYDVRALLLVYGVGVHIYTRRECMKQG